MDGGTPPPALLNSVDHAADKPILEPRERKPLPRPPGRGVRRKLVPGAERVPGAVVSAAVPEVARRRRVQFTEGVTRVRIRMPGNERPRTVVPLLRRGTGDTRAVALRRFR